MDIQEIFKRYLAGSCTQEELEFLFAYFENEQLDSRADLLALLEAEFQRDEWEDKELDELRHLVSRNRTRLAKSLNRKSTFRRGFWFSAAAVVLFLSAATFYFWDEGSHPQLNKSNEQVVRVSPGSNKAMIISADGKTIDLSDQQRGIVMDDDRQMSYADGSAIEGISDDSGAESAVYELVTPKGGTYQLTLSDGTRVWLNAASRLTYPQRFRGSFREVTLSGEAYFEVATNKDQPFMVKSEGQRVTVMGTAFNIAAYEDEENTRTTLVNGSVKVDIENDNSSAVDHSVWLHPGQQSILSQSKLVSLTVDPAAEIAWRSGRFYFDNQTIKYVMRQLSRWYDIEVVYEKGIENRRFSGSISRSNELEEVLYDLQLTKSIRFEIKGRRVTVIPPDMN